MTQTIRFVLGDELSTSYDAAIAIFTIATELETSDTNYLLCSW